MKQRLRIFYVGFSLSLLSSLALASQEVKVGVIDMQKIILEVEEGKDAIAKLQQVVEAKKAELTVQKQEIDELDKSLRGNQDLLSQDAKLNKQREIQEKFAKLQEAEMKFQAEIKQKEFQATQEIAAKAAKIASRLAEEAKLGFLFERNSSGLIYAASMQDLTTDVTAAYEKEFKKKLSKK